MRWARTAVSVALASAFAVHAVAHAEAQERELQPIHVQIDPTNACSTADRFFAEVAARTARVRLADASESAPTFVVSVRSEGGKIVGRLVLTEQSHDSEPRIVRVGTCDEAMSALALIAALSLDSNVQSPATAAPAVNVGGLSSTDANVSAAMTKQTEAESPGPSREQATPSERRWLFMAGGGLGAQTPSGTTGDILLAPNVFVDVAVDLPGIFAPDFRLSGARTRGVNVTTSVGTGRPLWLTLDLSFCPVRMLRRALSACADVEAGSLQVNATGPGTSSQSRPWLAPGLEGRFGWPVVSSGGRAELLVELELGLRAPLFRDTFYFLDNPNDFMVYAGPALVAHGAIELGVRF